MSDETIIDRDARAALAAILSNTEVLDRVNKTANEMGVEPSDAIAGAAWGFALSMQETRTKLKDGGHI